MMYKPVKISGCDVADNYFRENKKVWLATSLIPGIMLRIKCPSTP